jgi:hypothetical protein
VVVQTQAHERYRRAIATWDDVEEIALSLPATESGPFFHTHAWKVAAKPKPKAFAWVRPLRRSDITALTALGRDIPDGEILGLRTDGMLEKEAILHQFSDYVFDIPHFHNFSGVLVRLDAIPRPLLQELIIDAWRAIAPRDLTEGLQRGDTGRE